MNEAQRMDRFFLNSSLYFSLFENQAMIVYHNNMRFYVISSTEFNNNNNEIKEFGVVQIQFSRLKYFYAQILFTHIN